MNEFSVEPPGHSYDEYEVMDQTQLPHSPAEGDFESTGQSGPFRHPADGDYEAVVQIRSSCCPTGDKRELTRQVMSMSCPAEQQPHRPLLSVDANARHVKSLSLPYMTSPVHRPEELSSEEVCQWGNSDDSDSYDYEDAYGSDRDQDMCTKSLPLDFLFPPDDERDTGTQASRESDLVQLHQQLQISEGKHDEFPECGEAPAEDQRQIEVEKDGEVDGPEGSTGTEEDADERGGQPDSERR